jgi:uncharacterized protein YceH (UPF0502 family)
MEREDGPFIARLPRAAGARESRYAHLFSGSIESAPETADADEVPPTAGGTTLHQRVALLENQFAELRAELETLKGARRQE